MVLAVLTGGKSTRFGTYKCTYPFREKSLVEWVIGSIGSLFDRIVFVGNDPHLLRGRFLPDLHPERGPVGGLETVLMNFPNDDVFLTACDMPFIMKETVEFILSMKGDHQAVCPFVRNFYQVTHAVYSKKTIAKVEKELSRDNPSLKHLIFELKDPLILEESEFSRIENYRNSFENFNFKKDLDPWA